MAGQSERAWDLYRNRVFSHHGLTAKVKPLCLEAEPGRRSTRRAPSGLQEDGDIGRRLRYDSSHRRLCSCGQEGVSIHATAVGCYDGFAAWYEYRRRPS